MKGTESNEQNVVTALENVQRNDLGNLITSMKALIQIFTFFLKLKTNFLYFF